MIFLKLEIIIGNRILAMTKNTCEPDLRSKKTFLEAEISSRGQSWILLFLAKSAGPSAGAVELQWTVGEEKYRRRNGSF